MKGALVFVIGLFLLASCASTTLPLRQDHSHVARARLYNLKQFAIAGRVAVRTRDETWQADLRWEHLPNLDRLFLSGPFGQGAGRITVKPYFIEIIDSDGHRQVSDRPDTLLQQHLGFSVPLAQLKYWVLGLIAPGKSGDIVFDTRGVLSRVEQLGWVVGYRRFAIYDGRTMPDKLTIESDLVSLKLIIDQWEFNG